MGGPKDDDRREAVLFAFQEACPEPSTDDVVQWTTRYPDFADDILEHARVMFSMSGQASTDDPPSPELRKKARAQAQSALVAARRGRDKPEDAS